MSPTGPTPISVPDARTHVLTHAEPLPVDRCALDEALGRVLAEPIHADRDSPPFRKALVDGFAFWTGDAPGPGPTTLRVVATILAGQTPARPLDRGEAVAIMTGAPLPDGADAVAMVERVEPRPADGTVILPGPLPAGSNLLPRGAEMAAGNLVVPAGLVLTPARLGVLATVGRGSVRVHPRPVVSVVSTGDELVPADQEPGPGQIRDSNGPTLRGLARDAGAVVRSHPIAPDDPERLRRALAEAIDGADVVLISGGVSAGQRDLVPPTLVDLGVVPRFHQVRIKPGKPLWFGVGPARGDRPGALVFGLPGNPASGVVNFLVFVRPALDALAGRPPDPSYQTAARLAAPFTHRGDRPTYHPAARVGDQVTPLRWAGSADLRTIATADGFAVFPPGDRAYDPGEAVEFLRF